MRFSAGLIAVVMSLATACSGGGDSAGRDTTVGGADGSPKVTINPGDGTGKARPDKGVTVTAAAGTLSQVSVKVKGAGVPGRLSDDRRTWRSTWTLIPGAKYTVTATATSPSGKTTTAASGFRTIAAVAATSITNVIPSPGEKVGVGMPIIVQFNKTVPKGAQPAIEKSFEVRSTVPTEGAWRWLSAGESFNGLPSAVFRPRKPWKANQEVTFTAHYAGLRIGDAVFGAKDATRTFKIGDSHVVDIDSRTHRLVVKKNGRTVRTWGVSLGSGGDVQADGIDHLITTSGVHLTMNRSRLERMRPPGKKEGDPGWYDEQVPWATRISNSGEYIHQNMDDPSCLGRRNCSHGCVRSPAQDAQWFYGWAYRGDIVTIKGTTRKLGWTNGWGYWQMPFQQWLKGSVLGAPVTTSALPANRTA